MTADVDATKKKKPLLYTLPLADDGSPDNAKTYIRIPLLTTQETWLRFTIKPGSSVLRSNLTLYTTYPIHGLFDRSTFHSLPFIPDDPSSTVQTGYHCDLVLTSPGAYEYHVNDQQRSGYLIVEPRLYDRQQQPLPLDAVMMISVIPKWMGPIDDWKPHLDLIQNSAYNMIHFAPMQLRGASDSPYSIRDQLLFADDLFKDKQLSREYRLETVKTALASIQTERGILCLSDVVWNHTSSDSPFLLDHPDAGYNLQNSPHLVPAYELDTALLELSANLEKYNNLPCRIESVHDVDLVMKHIESTLFPELKLWEYKVLDADLQKKRFREAMQDTSLDPIPYHHKNVKDLPIEAQAELLRHWAIQSGNPGVRFHRSLDLPRAIGFMRSLTDSLEKQVAWLDKLLDQYNLSLYQEYDQDVTIALENIRSRIVYLHLDANGPKLREISSSCPLVETYFTRLVPKANDPSGTLQLANNGWIWNADPMQDFAGPGSSAYLRRQVICWSDCVKLRYGQKPEDNPWLWQHMKEYTEQVASLFQGFRIDNCHSTAIHVAQYLLDAARRVRPDLYVVAELFTGSPEMDTLFVSKLGIHALVREAMQAWDPYELSRLVHRHGGKPVGSMDQDMTWKTVHLDNRKACLIPIEHGSMPRALFMDCTHDNPTPFQKRTAEDTLPNAALVAFSDCAIGSVKGYDEIYPFHLNVASEKRLYSPCSQQGIVQVKRKLQDLHHTMAVGQYTEVHVHHEGDYILVHRQHPATHDGYLLVARTAFSGNSSSSSSDNIAPILLHMTQLKYLLGASLQVDTTSISATTKYLAGLPSIVKRLPEPTIHQHPKADGTWSVEIVLPQQDEFAPGSIYVFYTSIDSRPMTAIRAALADFPDVRSLDLLDCNVVLYRCEAEEMDATGGHGVYDVPRWGKLPYAGLEGFMAVLRPIIRDNDLGHPFCDNLRQGPWTMDYILGRLERYNCPRLRPLAVWLQTQFHTAKQLPHFLVPKYFAMIIQTAYHHVRQHALSCMSHWVIKDEFSSALALCSVQMHGAVPSTGLYPSCKDRNPSLAAGLPHFSTGYMRTWGRDVFISLRGLLLVTGQFDAAKRHILAFAATLCHGLLPNLLDAARSPRYNARDAVWWFLQSVQDYCSLAPDGLSILNESVRRRFPPDDRYVPIEEGYIWECSMTDIIQEIMQRHAQGIHFREHNAGPAIDQQMKDAGFNIDIDLDWTTGLLVGGNEWNCGTWMDKMGESAKAGNKGYPGTPRDGAPIEITGLLKSALRWIVQLVEARKFPYTGVQTSHGGTLTFREWNDRLQASFEHIYYIPKDPSKDKDYAVDPSIIHRRGIYKDVWKATHPYTEYQFRPSLCVAMVVAPELFDKLHAKECLELMHEVLLGPLGMRTLDPADLRYRPYYNNSDDSDDFDVSKGRNYHQGPEWVWLMGYYLRAAYHMGTLSPLAISKILRAHRDEILGHKNVWAGLPELTNKDGAFCPDSCFSQAWSASCLLDLLYDMQ